MRENGAHACCAAGMRRSSGGDRHGEELTVSRGLAMERGHGTERGIVLEPREHVGDTEKRRLHDCSFSDPLKHT